MRKALDNAALATRSALRTLWPASFAWWPTRPRRKLRPQREVVLSPYLDPGSRFGARRAYAGLALFCFIYGAAFALTAPFLILQFAFPVVGLGAVVIWALPDAADRAPLRMLQFLFFAFLGSLVLWPNYLALALPGLPWITAIRLLGVPHAVILMICVSVSPALREQLSDVLRQTPALWRLLVGFVVIQAISVAFSANKAVSLDKFVTAQFCWTAMFFSGAFIFSRPRMVERWAAQLWAMGVVVSIIALLEFREGHVLWAGHIPSLLKIDDPAVERMLAGATRAYTSEYRVQSTFGTSLGLGEYVALTLPFVMYFAVQPYRTWVRMAAGASLPLLVGATLVSGSRLGMIGVCLSVLLYLLFWGALRWRWHRKDIVGPAVVLAFPAMFVAFFAATFFVGRLHRAVWGGGETADSTQARFDQYKIGIPMVLERPWGHGIGRGAETLGWFTPGGVLTIDTYYLLVALEYGVVGFLAYFGMIALAGVRAARTAFDAPEGNRELGFLTPSAIALANFFIIKSVFSQQDNHPVVFMILGLVAALVYRARQAETQA